MKSESILINARGEPVEPEDHPPVQLAGPKIRYTWSSDACISTDIDCNDCGAKESCGELVHEVDVLALEL